MLTLRLAPLFAARAIEDPEAFLCANGFSPRTAAKLLHNPQDLSLRHIELLCAALHCTPNALFHFQPDDDTVPRSHPLRRLSGKAASPARPGLPPEDMEKLWDLIGTLLPAVSLGSSRRNPTA